MLNFLSLKTFLKNSSFYLEYDFVIFTRFNLHMTDVISTLVHQYIFTIFRACTKYVCHHGVMNGDDEDKTAHRWVAP